MIVDELLDRPHALILWDYLVLKQSLAPADFIFVMCSYNLNIADYAYILFQQGMGKKIVLSGGMVQTRDILIADWDDPEAVVFKNRLIELGMNKNDIIIEDKAEDTTQNAQYTRDLLAKELPEVTTGLIVHKPYMKRRAYMTACKEWPEITWKTTSPIISYEKYIDEFDEEKLINRLAREASKMKEEKDLKYQITPEKYEAVDNALKKLIAKGYKKYI